MTKQVSPALRVCLICIEFFGDSIYGGFGRATRLIGRELAKRGAEVSVVIPRRSPDLPDLYEIDGMRVHQYDPRCPWQGIRALRNCDADIYHSQDTSTTTFLAQIAKPGAVHVVTFRDPMDRQDWYIETKSAGMPRMGWAQYRYFIDNLLVALAVRRADSLHTAARFLEAKSAALYGLKKRPVFLPTPVFVPQTVDKALEPTVCYVGRWEGRKRVELFFELAKKCPNVNFIAVGGARDLGLDNALRRKYGSIENLHMTGVLDQFANSELWDVFSKSWVLVNTSLRESLPTTFIEAAAYRCAILSFSNPDKFAVKYGLVVQEGRLKEGLITLLSGNNWRQLGEAGHQQVKEVFAVENAMRAHIRLYTKLIGTKKVDR